MQFQTTWRHIPDFSQPTQTSAETQRIYMQCVSTRPYHAMQETRVRQGCCCNIHKEDKYLLITKYNAFLKTNRNSENSTIGQMNVQTA
jgi:hypothetical protein